MKAVTALVLLGLLAFAAADASIVDRFNAWTQKHNKNYDSAEWNARMLIFNANARIVDSLNQANGEPAFSLDGPFADLAPQEFRSRFLGYHSDRKNTATTANPAVSEDLPKSVDWRKKSKCISPVKNQGQCGSCWAFSATEEIESMWCLYGHPLIELSVQQIVSCDNNDGGCGGGDTITAYQYVESAGGLESARSYPYISGGGNNGNCRFDSKKIVANITTSHYATQDQDENAMMKFIANVGPLSTCVDASTWQFYTGGVIRNNCGQSLDHCVQTVGYNTDSNGQYWLVRNSWTTSWGEAGYIYIEIGKNLCGIADEATWVVTPKA